MKNKIFWAVAATVLFLCGCVKDQELYDKVDDLGNRVSALEETVKELNQVTIPGMQSIVAAIQGNIYVTSVTTTADGYLITFSNSTTAVIKNGTDGQDGKDGVDGEKGDKGETPVISVVEIDGEFYWAIDGEPLLNENGNMVSVYYTLPQLRIFEGKWQVSYDEGKTWKDVETTGAATGSTISIEDGDTTVTFYINGEAYTIQKELPFYLIFDSRKDIGVPVGEKYNFTYTIQGINAGDEVEVDVLSCTAGWEAEIVSIPSGDTPGVLAVTNIENNSGKVFVYASNGRGKTDIKSLLFEDGVLTAEADVKPVPAAGGEVTVSVTTNMSYELYVDKTQGWISVLPATKATHTDVYTLACAKNETGDFRSAEVDVINTQTAEVVSVYVVLQYPSETVTTSIASLANVADNTPVVLYNETVLASSEISAVVSDGTSFLSVRGLEEALTLGNEIVISGVKKSDADGTVYVELTSFEVAAETSAVSNPETTYYGLATGDELPLYTSVTGPLANDGSSYSVTAYEGQKVVVEAPAAGYELASNVGKTVTVYGYITAIEEVSAEETYTIIINNVSVVEFKENASWELSYKNDPTVEAGYPEIITNTVSGSSVPYQLALISEEAYNEIGSAETFALALCDDLQYTYWYYGLLLGYSQSDLYSIFVHADGATGYDAFKEIEYGRYYAVAVGINPDGTATGDYKVQAFEKTEPKSIATYEDFIGEWTMGSDILVVTEKVNGKTYNVTGIAKQESLGVAPVEAEFVDGKFILKEQDTEATYQNVNYGTCNVCLSGGFIYGGNEYGAYPVNVKEKSVIFTGYMFDDSGTVTVEPGSCSFGPFMDIVFSWVIPSGENAGKGNSFTPGTAIVSQMTKYVDSIPAELLGKWVCKEKADMWGEDTYTDWTITIEKSGTGVAMKGFDAGMDDVCRQNGLTLVYPVASWDPDAQTLTVQDNTPTGIASNGDSINWRGFVGDYYRNIVFTADLNNGILSLAVDGFMACNTSGAFSGFEAPLEFNKEGTGTSSTRAVKSAVHSSKVNTPKANSMSVYNGDAVAKTVKVPVQKTLDARVAKSGKASVVKLSK